MENLEIYSGEACERRHAIIEFLAQSNMIAGAGHIQDDKAWTYKSPLGIETRYDMIWSDTPYNDEGLREMDPRGDHRPATVRREVTPAEVIAIVPRRPHPMTAWTPTRASAARLARRWAQWNPKSAADSQQQLEEAAGEEEAALQTAADSERPPRARGRRGPLPKRPVARPCKAS